MRHSVFGLQPVCFLLTLFIASHHVVAEDATPLKAGIIGLDAHARSWAKILNNPDAEGELADLRVVAGYPAGSPDIPQSQKLLKKGIEAFQELGIPLVDSIDTLIRKSDVVMILSIDGRPHLAQAQEVIKAGKPVFIDKPVAGSLADAKQIYALARKHEVPCFSSSSLRFAPGTRAVLDNSQEGKILGCDAHSPCAIEPHHPDFFWYGIHGVETLFTIMGTGCETVTRTHTKDADVAVGAWQDGRIGTFRGHRTGPHTYGATVFGKGKVVQAGEFEGYEPLLVEIVKFFKTGVPPVSPEETLEILAFMEAADKSKEKGGRPVKLPSIQLAKQPAEGDEEQAKRGSRQAKNSDASTLPEVAGPSTAGYVSGELIYPLDNKPTPQCHASTIVETPAGPVAAWFGGRHEKNPDVGIWVARHRNGQWTQPVEVADGVQSSEQRYPCWNPVLFNPQNGPLMLFYKVGPSPRQWWGMLKTSIDNGKSWSASRRLGENPKIGHLIGPVKNKPVQLADGSILCPSSTEHDGWRVHFELTPDLGKSWKVIGPIHDGEQFSAIQPSILTYPDGKMQVLCRSRQQVITQSWSADGGETWSKMTATQLPNPNAGTDAVTLRDGRQLLVYNHTTRGGPFPSGRNMLNVAVSRDGREWNTVLTLEKQKGEYSYPAVIQTDDGKVHITYTYRRQSVKHVVLDPERIPSCSCLRPFGTSNPEGVLSHCAEACLPWPIKRQL